MTIAEKLLRANTDIDEVHEAGYNKGNADGQATGYTNGYNQCTADMQDDLEAKYDEGYEEGVCSLAPLVFQEKQLSVLGTSFCKPESYSGTLFENQYDISTWVSVGTTGSISPEITISATNSNPKLTVKLLISVQCVTEDALESPFTNRYTLTVPPNSDNSSSYDCSYHQSATFEWTVTLEGVWFYE